MKKNFIFFIFSLALLMHESFGESEEETTRKPSPEAFRQVDVEKLASLSVEPIKLGKKLMDDAYADKSNNENVTEVLAAFQRRFKKIDTDEPTDRVEAFIPFIMMFDIASGRVAITNDAGIANELQAYKVALEKLDYKSVANEFQQKFEEFLESLNQELETKSDKLTPEEQRRIKAFKDLLLEFKNETNLVKKLDALANLLRRTQLSIID